MSPQPGATATNRVWSHNTSYTGIAGIHSEEGPLAHARNSQMTRRSSATTNVEEEILRKKIQSLAVSRKSLETSMLSYSQKMKDITDKREQMAKSSSQKPLALTLTNNNNNSSSNNNNNYNSDTSTIKSLIQHSGHGQRVNSRHLSLPFLSEPKDDIRSLVAEKQLHNIVSMTSDQRGRISVDSGFGTESDCYLSDAESVTRPRLMSNASSTNSDDVSQESSPSPNGKTVGRKRGQTRPRRFRRVENSELATVIDTEGPVTGNEEEEKRDTTSTDANESVKISPFPENNYYKDIDALSSRLGSISEIDDDLDSDHLNRTRILNPLASSPTRQWKQSTSPRPKKKTPHVLTKPKAAYSPSVGSIRLRRYQRKPNKNNSKSNRQSFKYSDAVETALRSLNNSPEGRRDPPESPDLPGLNLNELLNDVIQRPYDREMLNTDEPEEFKPHRLFRERSFSEPPPFSKPPSFNSTLEQVREDDDAQLRSVLKKNAVQYPAEKKSVQFFLPDIFLHANACTSRPAALR